MSKLTITRLEGIPQTNFEITIPNTHRLVVSGVLRASSIQSTGGVSIWTPDSSGNITIAGNVSSSGGQITCNVMSTNGRINLPTWTSSTRPTTNLVPGTLGYNVDVNSLDIWNGSFWSTSLGTQSNPATSASAILAANPSAPDGAYWIRPAGAPEAFLVHCYMTIEGGGWMLVLRNTSNELGSFGSGSFLVSNWNGWTFNTKSQIDSLGFDYSTAADTNCFTPVYAYSSFTDVMVIANRSGQQSKRIGWRHSGGITNMHTAINTSNEKAATSVLFGDAFNWLRALDVRSDTNVMPAQTGTVKVGFKIRSDTGSSLGTGNFVGGFHTSAMHYGSQIGCGRDNSNGNEWGGGFGGAYTTGPRFHRLNGHWWNHGDGRNSSVWNAQNDFSSAMFGHAVYVR